jgi:hypothetical protein
MRHAPMLAMPGTPQFINIGAPNPLSRVTIGAVEDLVGNSSSYDLGLARLGPAVQ